ncbi:MAG TPA: hypothetical protein VFO85_18265, partial [Vicinamibacteria bacterium]|nr:hypothetical protein [Vicinamibacteria bacterium]
MRDPDEAGIRRYLLGQLPEGQAELVEEGYLASPEVFQRVRGVEDDLLDDYAAGRLTAEDRAAFEARYLAAPALRQRVEAARALRGRGQGRSAARAAASRSWLAPGLAAAVLLAFATGGVFWMSGPRRASHPTPSSPPRPASPLPGPTAVAGDITPPSPSTPA